MGSHENARTTARGRLLMIERLRAGWSIATVAAAFGLRALDPKPAIIRYKRENPGELLHLDIKKLGRIDGIGHRITGDRTGQSGKRGTGWDYLHVAIDDASRLAFTALLPDERKETRPASSTTRWPGSAPTASACSG